MNWEEIKSSGNVFPETKIAIAEKKFDDNQSRTAWINTGYKDYPYKEFCETLGILSVEFEDMNGVHEQEIQIYFEEELNKACVSHLMSRIPTDYGIEMLFYFEDREIALNRLNELYENEDKLVDFGCEFQSDPEWDTIKGMMENFSK